MKIETKNETRWKVDWDDFVEGERRVARVGAPLARWLTLNSGCQAMNATSAAGPSTHHGLGFIETHDLLAGAALAASPDRSQNTQPLLRQAVHEAWRDSIRHVKRDRQPQTILTAFGKVSLPRSLLHDLALIDHRHGTSQPCSSHPGISTIIPPFESTVRTCR